MQTVTLKIQDKILDKLILLLNDFSKEDVEIIKVMQDFSDKNYMETLRNRHIKINKNLDIDKITDEINNGLS